MDAISVLIVDDRPEFLRFVTAFLREYPAVIVIGTADGGKTALARAEELRPQVILLDLLMPGMNGLEAIPRLRALLPEVRIVVLTMLGEDCYRRAALAAGADGFVPKRFLDTALLPIILEVAGASQLSR